MANFSFALRLAFGLLPKTEKIEEERNQLIAEFNRLNEFKNSEELKTFNELQEYVNSTEFKNKKAAITSLSYNNSEEYKKEKRQISLQKDKRIKNYFKVLESDKYRRFKTIEESNILKQLNELTQAINTPEFAKAKADPETKESCVQQEKELKRLKKNPDIVFWTKYQKKGAYKMFMQVAGSSLLEEYNTLCEYVKTDEFKNQKAYLLDKNRFNSSEEAKKEQQFDELKNSANIKWYQATVNSNKFDTLKAWKLTFEDNFDTQSIDESKWMNSFFWGKMLLNDRYVLAGDKQYYTDNKNININQSVLQIITKKEKTSGRVWSPKHGFYNQDFDYTSGMLSTANSFRQQYGRFEAKIKIDAENPVYQAFWLKGENKEPQIDIFKFNIKKSGSMQVSAYNKGKAAGSRFGGAALAKDYFIYTIDWTANSITWKINGIEVASTNNAIPQEPLFIMLSAGLLKNADNAPLPSKFEVDWVRCYEKA